MNRRARIQVAKRPKLRIDPRLAAIVLGTGLLAWFATSSSIVLITRNASPSLALRLNPTDPVALVKQGDQRLAQGISNKNMLAAIRTSLETDPLNAGGIRHLAIDHLSSGNIAKTRSMLALAEKLSRREVATQLLLIEMDLANQNIDGTLERYDLVLRVSPATRPLLFELMNDAGAEPNIRPRLVALLRSNPPWLAALLEWAIYSEVKITGLAGVFKEIPAKSTVWTETNRRLLIDRLVAHEHLDEAYVLYRQVQPDQAKPEGGLALNSNTTYPPFDWQISPDPGKSVAGGGDSGGENKLQYLVDQNVGGALLSRLLRLPLGKYRLNVAMELDKLGGDEFGPEWSVACYRADGEAGSSLLKMDMGVSGISNKSGLFQVPVAGCAFQKMILSVSATRAPDGQSGAINSASIKNAI